VQPAPELGALDRAGAELDRTLVRALGAGEVTSAPEQLGVRGVQRLVVLERTILEQRPEQLEPASAPAAKPTAAARLSSTTGGGLSFASAPYD